MRMNDYSILSVQHFGEGFGLQKPIYLNKNPLNTQIELLAAEIAQLYLDTEEIPFDVDLYREIYHFLRLQHEPNCIVN